MDTVDKPSDLSDLGEKAFETLVKFFTKHEMNLGGNKLYSPQEWKDRGEDYGTSGVLIVCHDGGDHAGAFNSDYEQYNLYEEMIRELGKVGLWVEQCTSWYSAIYKD